MPYTYKYPRPALTVDCVVFGWDEESLRVLLIQRDNPPYEGTWALPGGFVDMDESLEDAARRELQEETGLKIAYLQQLHTFGDVHRDPRGRVVSVAYYALVKRDAHQVKAASDARVARWFLVKRPPKLAFDHKLVFRAAYDRLQTVVRSEPILFDVLPRYFTIAQVHQLYEATLNMTIDQRSFRRRLLAAGILTQAKTANSPKRFRFDKKQYRTLAKDGFRMEL